MRDSWVLRGSRHSYSLIWTLLIGRSPRAVSWVAGRLNGAPLPQEEVALNSCRGEKLVCAIHCQMEGCWRGGEESFGITLSEWWTYPAAVSMGFFPPPHKCSPASVSNHSHHQRRTLLFRINNAKIIACAAQSRMRLRNRTDTTS